MRNANPRPARMMMNANKSRVAFPRKISPTPIQATPRFALLYELNGNAVGFSRNGLSKDIVEERMRVT